MAKTFYYLFKEARPYQWIKNLIIFSAIFFTGELLTPEPLYRTILAFLAFCAASSSIYIFNDYTDIEKDKLHPFKRHRPLAAGKISPKFALGTAVVLTLGAFFIASNLSLSFSLTLLAFYILHISYSLFIKEIMLLDIMAIASGFILRIFAGEVATGFHIDVWLLLTVISAALFIAIGKRRSELTLLSGWQGAIPAKTRSTLTHYSERMLDVYISMFANSTWITYAFYTFLQQPVAAKTALGGLVDSYNLNIFDDRKWMMITIPVAIYGIMRYLQLIYEKNVGESPEKILLFDRPIILTSIIMGTLLFTIIYIIGR